MKVKKVRWNMSDNRIASVSSRGKKKIGEKVIWSLYAGRF